MSTSKIIDWWVAKHLQKGFKTYSCIMHKCPRRQRGREG